MSEPIDEVKYPWEAETAEHRRLSAALDKHHGRLLPKWNADELNENEQLFMDFWYYWAAGIQNSDSVFQYMGHIIRNKEGFKALSAVGTLKAVERLMPRYLQRQQQGD